MFIYSAGGMRIDNWIFCKGSRGCIFLFLCFLAIFSTHTSRYQTSTRLCFQAILSTSSERRTLDPAPDRTCWKAQNLRLDQERSFPRQTPAYNQQNKREMWCWLKKNIVGWIGWPERAVGMTMECIFNQKKFSSNSVSVLSEEVHVHVVRSVGSC